MPTHPSIQIPTAMNGSCIKASKRRRSGSKVVGVAEPDGATPKAPKLRRYETPEFFDSCKAAAPLFAPDVRHKASAATASDPSKTIEVTPEEASGNLDLMKKVLDLHGLQDGPAPEWYWRVSADLDGLEAPLGYGEDHGTHGVGGTCSVQ